MKGGKAPAPSPSISLTITKGKRAALKVGPVGFDLNARSKEILKLNDASVLKNVKGKAHTNTDGTKVETPHVHEKEKNVRPAKRKKIIKTIS